MTATRDVMAYFCQHYPLKGELSKARLTKMVYLADWKSSIQYGKQITDIEWEYNHYGPYVADIANIARSDPAFELVSTTNLFGSHKEIIRLKKPPNDSSLTRQEQEVLNFVIKTTVSKSWDEFIRLVYSTYPIMTQPKFAHLDLVALARQYQSEEYDLTQEEDDLPPWTGGSIYN